MRRQIAAASLTALTACVGTADSVLDPTPPEPDHTNTLSRDVIGVAAGMSFSCGLNRDGTIACWGYAWDPAEMTPPYGSFTAISAGNSHACALRLDGTITCWGSDRETLPETLVAPPGRFISISAGNTHNCALRPDRTAVCWGQNRYGESVAPAGTFLAISPGFNHTCGVRDNGAIECWGRADMFGTPPAGTYVDVTVRNTGYMNCGLQSSAVPTCWAASAPIRTPQEPFITISSGFDYTCGIREAGTLICWSHEGEAGWAPEGEYVALQGGYYHFCAIRNDGRVMCWGNDWYGQSSTPPQI
jgi:alpha-tubulin suppressor-like RCC1 family protein